MPWAEGELTISGDSAVIEEFKKHSHGDNGVLDMGAFIPYPRVYKWLDHNYLYPEDRVAHMKDVPKDVHKVIVDSGLTTARDGLSQGGLGWLISKWGTKNNFKRPRLVPMARATKYAFKVVIPPIKVLKVMSEQYPTLLLTYRHWAGAEGFKLVHKVKAGVVLTNEKERYRGERGA
jgi:hypothetical protein